MIKINEEQINKLLTYCEKYGIFYKLINQICNVKCITEITVIQYNGLLMLIESLLEKKEN